jgi:hypothetical protein
MAGRFASDDPRFARKRGQGAADPNAALAQLTRGIRQSEMMGQQGPAMSTQGSGLRAKVAAAKRARAAQQRTRAIELGLKTRNIA